MRFTSILITLALSLNVLADSQPFHLVTVFPEGASIPPESYVENATLYVQHGQLYIGGTPPIVATVDTESRLKLDDGKYVQVEPYGWLFEATKNYSSTGFSIENGYLYYNRSQIFQAAQKQRAKVISVKKPEGNETATFVKAQPINGGNISNFP